MFTILRKFVSDVQVQVICGLVKTKSAVNVGAAKVKLAVNWLLARFFASFAVTQQKAEKTYRRVRGLIVRVLSRTAAKVSAFVVVAKKESAVFAAHAKAYGFILFLTAKAMLVVLASYLLKPSRSLTSMVGLTVLLFMFTGFGLVGSIVVAGLACDVQTLVGNTSEPETFTAISRYARESNMVLAS